MAKKTRKQHFARWWSRNHHNEKAQKWLVRNAKRVIHTFYLHPAIHEDVHYISKRFFESNWPRLKQMEAWTLWKVCHPSKNERNTAIIETTKVLDERIHELEQLKREAQGKHTLTRPPLILEQQ